MRFAPLAACAIALLAAQATSAAPPVRLMQPGALERLPARPADFRIKYGKEPSQFGDLRVPRGKGPHPVVVMIHGGCWKQRYASLRDLAAMGDAFTAAGIATWNVEYRRLGEAGAGWPGTYLDVGFAIDHLRVLAKTHALDLSRVVVLGHSAGGHLAHWAAARARLPRKSEIYMHRPLPLRGVINLAGRMDMTAGIEHYEGLCRDGVVRGLLGGDPAQVPQRYRDASPINHLPLGVPQVLVWGDHEDFVPESLLHSFAGAARRAGDHVEVIAISDAGHFEAASPRSRAWPQVLRATRRLLDKGR